jgi:hypothetical protein
MNQAGTGTAGRFRVSAVHVQRILAAHCWWIMDLRHETGLRLTTGTSMHTPTHQPSADRVVRTASRYQLFISQLWKSIAMSYIFWAAFSFVNFGNLFPLAFPIFLPFAAQHFLKFANFLLVPVVNAALVAIVVGVMISYIMRRIKHLKYTAYLLPLLVNAVFLVTFLVSAERAKAAAIAKVMKGRSPDCLVVTSFLHSLRIAGQEHTSGLHAIYTEKGRMYNWSFKLMRFYEVRNDSPETTPCKRSRYQ